MTSPLAANSVAPIAADSGLSSPKYDSEFEPLHTPSTRGNAAVEQLLNRERFQLEKKELDVNEVSEVMRGKNINPSSLKFGFLGLGVMGSGIVKNLINSGHKVVVWNRTFTKCRKFELAGAEVAPTPSDVIDKVDITFSCVSDPVAAKEVSLVCVKTVTNVVFTFYVFRWCLETAESCHRRQLETAKGTLR